MRPFIVKELLSSSVADAVVGHEDDKRVFQQPFFIQARYHSAHMQVCQANAVEIERPIFQQNRISRVIGRQRDFLRIRRVTELSDDALLEGRPRLFRTLS